MVDEAGHESGEHAPGELASEELASEEKVSLTQPRWTHVAIPSSDLERSIDFYTQLAPLVVVHPDGA